MKLEKIQPPLIPMLAVYFCLFSPLNTNCWIIIVRGGPMCLGHPYPWIYVSKKIYASSICLMFLKFSQTCYQRNYVPRSVLATRKRWPPRINMIWEYCLSGDLSTVIWLTLTMRCFQEYTLDDDDEDVRFSTIRYF